MARTWAPNRARELHERVGLGWLIVPLGAIEAFASEVMPLLT